MYVHCIIVQDCQYAKVEKKHILFCIYRFLYNVCT